MAVDGYGASPTAIPIASTRIAPDCPAPREPETFE
jgi:hypothetical protein